MHGDNYNEKEVIFIVLTVKIFWVSDLKTLLKYSVVFGLGAFAYGLLEISFRSYTHWTMFLTGGTVLCLLYYIYNNTGVKSFWARALIGCAVITSAELMVGVYANMVYGLGVWDYSQRPFNFYGQICLLFSGLWLLLSIPVSTLTSFLNRKLNM